MIPRVARHRGRRATSAAIRARMRARDGQAVEVLARAVVADQRAAVGAALLGVPRN